MNGFESSIVIERPVEEVFAFLADLEKDVDWRREWVDGKKTSEGPIGLGSTFRLVGKAFGSRFDVDYEMTEYAPNRIAAWKSVSGPLPLRFWRIFEPVDGGTRVTIRYEAEPRGFLELVKPLVGPLLTSMGKRQLEGDLPKLTALMKARAPRDG
jgi:uncharacterized membrane protein